MTVRRPIVRIGGRNRQLPAGDTLQDVAQWYFGTGTPSDGGGAPGDYYVGADNKLWRKGATTWTYTGVQYGALAAVPEKAAPVDADVLGLGDSANGFQLAKMTLADLKAIVSPAGSVTWFATTTPPQGYLKANGAELSRETYARLFDVIGITFGEGDGSATFKLPDLRGLFVRGWADTAVVDAGRAFGSLQSDAYAAHSHAFSTSAEGAHTHNLAFGANTGGPNGTGAQLRPVLESTNHNTTSSSGLHSHTGSTISSGGSETRPKNIALLPCIKY